MISLEENHFDTFMQELVSIKLNNLLCEQEQAID